MQRQEGADGQSRFGMLETVRDYAAAQLSASDAAATLHARHAAYYLALAQAAERAWDGPTEWAWLGRLVAERDNLRAALRWALDRPDPALALRLNAALFSFWTTCSALPEARRWVEAALALPAPDAGPDLVAVEAKVRNVAGYVAVTTADAGQAVAYFEQGLALYRGLDDQRGVAWSLRGRALVHLFREEYAAAGRLYHESLRPLYRERRRLGPGLVALCAGLLAPRARRAGAGRRRRWRRRWASCAGRRCHLGSCARSSRWGRPGSSRGMWRGRRRWYREGLALSRETPLLTVITTGLEGLGLVAAAQGLPLRTARLWGAAEALREVTDERRWPLYQRTYDRVFAAARGQVAAAEWAAAWAAGRALPVAQALAEGLADAPPGAPSDERLLLIGSGPL